MNVGRVVRSDGAGVASSVGHEHRLTPAAQGRGGPARLGAARERADVAIDAWASRIADDRPFVRFSGLMVGAIVCTCPQRRRLSAERTPATAQRECPAEDAAPRRARWLEITDGPS